MAKDNEKGSSQGGDVKELWEKIKDVRVAMLTTAEADGTLRSRPMATQIGEFDGSLYFFTADNYGKALEIERDNKVNLSYADPSKTLYISVSGTAEIVHDKEKEKQFWNPFVKAWFPEGLDDPTLALLKVTIEQAEYWDAPNGKLVQIAALAKSMVTGKSAEDIGEDKKINL